MSKIEITHGDTQRAEYFRFQDPTSIYGEGLTGLHFQVVGLYAYYVRDSGTQVQIPLVSQTPTGPYVAGGFAEVSKFTMPGWYRFDLPDAMWAFGSNGVRLNIDGSGDLQIIPISAEYHLSDSAYHAKVRMDVDNVGGQDEYAVLWYKNAIPVTSGQLTSPQINVIRVANGTDLIATTNMSYVSVNTGAVKYNETSNRISTGEPYIIRVLGTIDGEVKVWQELVARDS